MMAMSVIKDIPSDDMPFVNLKIGGSIVDFDGKVSSTDTYGQYQKSSIQGRITDQPISKSQNVSMLWETGFALKNSDVKHCNVEMTSCYEAKTVPVVESISHVSGYTSGS
jgi:hypothetical protein